MVYEIRSYMRSHQLCTYWMSPQLSLKKNPPFLMSFEVVNCWVFETNKIKDVGVLPEGFFSWDLHIPGFFGTCFVCCCYMSQSKIVCFRFYPLVFFHRILLT